ncbi:MAG: hypothetical protein PF503_23355 [Desulfobacula sp.]|nr:hypothetical protein [Desulfobacula sp.]
MAETAFLIQISTYKKILHLTLLFLIIILSAVLALTVVEVDALTDAGVVNIAVRAAVDVDPEVLNDADKLGLGGLLPGPGSPAGKKLPVSFG